MQDDGVPELTDPAVGPRTSFLAAASLNYFHYAISSGD